MDQQRHTFTVLTFLNQLLQKLDTVLVQIRSAFKVQTLNPFSMLANLCEPTQAHRCQQQPSTSPLSLK